MNSLSWVPDSVIFLILVAVHFDKWGTIASVEARMLASAEVIEFVKNVIEVRAESVKHDCKLPLLFLHVH